MNFDFRVKKATAALLLVTLTTAIQMTTVNAYAMGKARPAPVAAPSPKPSPAPSPSGAPSPAPTFTVTPDSLRTAVLFGNLTLVGELDQVHIEKDQANLAQTNLLPTISLAAVLGAATGGISFALAGVSMLIGFLMPSNWTAMKQADDLFDAEKVAYQILELNTYASAESMYYTILAENELLEAQRQDYNDLQKTADIISEGNTLLGVTSPTDVAQAEAAALASQGQYLNLQEVIGQENKQMLSVMNLTDPHTELVYGDDEAAPSSAEGQDVQAVINQAIKVAPEKVQIDYLVAAAKEGKWTQTFSYLGGNSTLSTSSGSNGTGSTGFSSSSLSSLYLHDTLNLGFGIFPTIQLGNDNIAVTELRQTELVNEEQLTISSAMLSLASALQQYELANKATVDAQKVYNDKNNAYQMGFATLLDVLSARTALTQAEMTSVKAKLDLNLQRLTMHRSLLDDQFALIPPCKMTAPPKKDLGALWDWIKGVFVGEQPSNSNIDKDCRPDPAPSAAPVPA